MASKKIDGAKLSGALQSGATLDQTAKAAGVSKSTVQRRVKADNAGHSFGKVRNVNTNANVNIGKNGKRK